MEIPIAMIVACRLLPFRANRLANIIAGGILTLINGFLTFIPPLVGARTPALPEYLFFATIETVCTSVIVWQAWTWSGGEAQLVRSGSSANRKLGSLLLNYRILKDPLREPLPLATRFAQNEVNVKRERLTRSSW